MSLAPPQVLSIIHRRPDSEPMPHVGRGNGAHGGVLDCLLDSSVLLRGEREVLIRHGGETYRLRHTRNDKLILTK